MATKKQTGKSKSSKSNSKINKNHIRAFGWSFTALFVAYLLIATYSPEITGRSGDGFPDSGSEGYGYGATTTLLPTSTSTSTSTTLVYGCEQAGLTCKTSCDDSTEVPAGGGEIYDCQEGTICCAPKCAAFGGTCQEDCNPDTHSYILEDENGIPSPLSSSFCVGQGGGTCCIPKTLCHQATSSAECSTASADADSGCKWLNDLLCYQGKENKNYNQNGGICIPNTALNTDPAPFQSLEGAIAGAEFECEGASIGSRTCGCVAGYCGAECTTGDILGGGSDRRGGGIQECNPVTCQWESVEGGPTCEIERARFVNSNGQLLSSAKHGQQVYLEVEYTATECNNKVVDFELWEVDAFASSTKRANDLGFPTSTLLDDSGKVRLTWIAVYSQNYNEKVFPIGGVDGNLEFEFDAVIELGSIKIKERSNQLEVGQTTTSAYGYGYGDITTTTLEDVDIGGRGGYGEEDPDPDPDDPSDPDDGNNGGSGSGGGSSGDCVPIWDTAEWTKCFEGVQYRAVQDLNNCGTDNNRPISSRSCLGGREPISPGCQPVPSCTEWSTCTSEGLQTKECQDTTCGSGEYTDTQSCVYQSKGWTLFIIAAVLSAILIGTSWPLRKKLWWLSLVGVSVIVGMLIYLAVGDAVAGEMIFITLGLIFVASIILAERFSLSWIYTTALVVLMSVLVLFLNSGLLYKLSTIGALLIILAVYLVLYGTRKKQVVANPSVLGSFIKNSKKKGYTDEQITKALTEKGWPKKLIEKELK